MSIDLGSAIVSIGADVNPLASVLGQAGSMIGGFGGIAAGALTAAGVAALGVGAASVKMAGDFESSVTSLVTGAGESVKNVDMIKQGLLDLSASTATPTKNLVDGLYMIESAGYHGAQGLTVLKAAAQGAKVGNADLGVVSNALTTILTDYHLSADQATGATNALVQTVADGKTHMQDLASALGSVLPLASSLGISLPQVAGGLAVMTNAGMSAQRASANLANAIRSLAAPNATAQKSMEAVGMTAQQLKDTLSTQGLTGAIQMVEEHIGQKFPAGSVQAVQAFKAIMGGATGYNVALMLGGKNMAAYESNVANITAAMNNGKDGVMGWAMVQQDFNFKMEQANQALQAVMIKIGSALLPALSQALGAITPLISRFSDWITQSNVLQNVTNALSGVISQIAQALSAVFPPVQKVATAFAQTTTAGKPLLDTFDRASTAIHATTQAVKPLSDTLDRASGVIHTTTQAVKPLSDTFDRASGAIHGTTTAVKQHTDVVNPWVAVIRTTITVFTTLGNIITTTIKVIQTIIQIWQTWGPTITTVAGILTALFIPALIKTGVESVVNGAKMAVNYVANLIKVGVEGWQAAAKLGQFILSVIKSGVEAVVAGAKIAANFVASMVKSGVEAVASGAKVVASFVAGVVKSGVEAVVAGAKITAQFVAGIVKAGAEAVIAGAKMVASLVPAIISVATEGLIAAATAIPGLIAGFIGWATTAGAAAIATIAATWPILLIIAAIALLVVGIILLVQHWSQVTAFLQSTWQSFTAWLSNSWNSLSNWASGLAGMALQWGKNLIQGFINGIGSMLGAVGQAASNVVSTVTSFLGFHSPAKQGPGRDADTWAPNLLKMFNAGLQEGQPALNATLNTMLAPHVYPSGMPTGALRSTTGSSSSGSAQPLHISLHIDGQQIGHALVNDMRLRTAVRL